MDDLPGFLIPPGFEEELRFLRDNYQRLTGLDLSTAQQPYAISCFFGAKNVNARDEQILFVEKWLEVLNLTHSHFQSIEEIAQAYLRALRVLVTLCLYTKSQLSSSAILAQLIDNALGLSKDNHLDDKTRNSCLLTTKYYLKTYFLEARNASVSFTEQELAGFSAFVKEQCKNLDNKEEYHPIRNLTMPLFSKPLEGAGYAVGFLMGRAIANSATLLPTQYRLTTVLIGGVLLTMPNAAVGISLVGPTIAAHFLETFAGISLAWLLAQVGKITGEGIGYLLGFSLEYSAYLIGKGYSLIINQLHSAPENSACSGISLINGQQFVNGVSYKKQGQLELPKIIINGDIALVKIDEQVTTVPLNPELKVHSREDKEKRTSLCQ